MVGSFVYQVDCVNMGMPIKTIMKRKNRGYKRFNKKGASFAVSRPIGRASNLKDIQTIDTLATFGGTVTTSVLYSQVFLPVPGTGTSSRYGDRTSINSIYGSLIVSPGVSQLQTTFIRVMLFWDNQPNGANPTSPQPLGASTVVAFPNADFRYRFKMLRDFVFPVAKLGSAPEGLSGDNSRCYMQKFYINKCDLVSQFTAGAGAITDVATGALVVGVVSDTSLTTNNTPNVSFNIRANFRS